MESKIKRTMKNIDDILGGIKDMQQIVSLYKQILIEKEKEIEKLKSYLTEDQLIKHIGRT